MPWGYRTGRARRARITAALACAGSLTLAAAAGAGHLPHKSSPFTQDLLSDANVELDGAQAGDFVGGSLAAAGDVNGDGRDDVIVGASQGAGTAFVIFGRADETTIDLADIGTAGNTDGFRINGAGAGDHAGSGVAGVGRMNGDNLDDVIVGASGAGEAYVVFGKTDGASIDLGSLGAGGFTISGTGIGSVVAGVGDVSEDGVPDVALGAPDNDPTPLRSDAGQLWVVFGKSNNTAAISLGPGFGTPVGDAGYRLDGVASVDALGSSVDAAGDVNGDGVDDLIAGAPRAPDNALSSGVAYVLFGGDGNGDGGAAPPTPGFANVDARPGFQIQGGTTIGASNDLNIGRDVSGVGDMDGDGFDDVASGGGQGARGAWVVFGKDDQDAVNVISSGFTSVPQGFKIQGPLVPNPGAEVDGAGDLNGDGTPDVLVSDSEKSANGRNASGSVYAVFGKASGSTVTLDNIGTAGNTDGFRVDGAVASDRLGGDLAAAGDFNGDGAPDLIAGASGADRNSRTDSGAAYVSYGFETTAPTVQIDSGPADPTNQTGAAFSFTATDNNTAPGNVLTVECRLDGSAFTACDTPTSASYPGLMEGDHTFQVQATDSFHNGGPAATYTWTVDLTPPSLVITDPAVDGTTTGDRTPSFLFSAETGATVLCSFVPGAGAPSFGSCGGTPGSFTPGSDQPDGPYVFTVQATDAAGNTSTATRTITIAASPPPGGGGSPGGGSPGGALLGASAVKKKCQRKKHRRHAAATAKKKKKCKRRKHRK